MSQGAKIYLSVNDCVKKLYKRTSVSYTVFADLARVSGEWEALSFRAFALLLATLPKTQTHQHEHH